MERIYVGVTDYDWYTFLKNEKASEVNFWRPSGEQLFKALDENELFLFKLKKVHGNKIVGGGFFKEYKCKTMNEAWETYGKNNGCSTEDEFATKIFSLKRDNSENIGCIILTKTFWLDEESGIRIKWNGHCVQGALILHNPPKDGEVNNTKVLLEEIIHYLEQSDDGNLIEVKGMLEEKLQHLN